MNSKLLLIIVALIVVFAAFTLFANKNTSTPSSTKQSDSMKSQQATPVVTQANMIANVILGDTGFVPKDITVKPGTRVVWVNKSGKAATVSSDDHPTHSLYPFLNLGEFANGTTVQVVVEKPGKYSYHNHLNASEVGTITAE